MSERPIPNAVPHLAGNEWRYLKECLDTNWVSSVGPFVERFERETAAAVGASHAVATVTGTAALHVALLTAGVRPGDEVLVPTLTFIATASAVCYCGATPVFIDVEASSWGMDPAKVEDFLAKECDVRDGVVVNRATGRVVRAMLPVHLYGHPVDLDAFLDLAARWPVTLVEDSAESLGGRYKNRPVGVAGLVGCLSFNGNKVITTGGGGMLLTNDAAVAARARSLTTQARADALEWIHHDVAYNYRLTNLQAALGVAQLEQLGAFVEDKRRTAAAYAAAVAGLDGVQMFAEQPWARSTYWMPSVLLDPRQFGAARDVVRAANTDGIGLRPLWYPLHRQPVFADRQAYRIEVADDLHARGLSLPCSVGITEDERARVIDRLSRCRRAR